MEGTYGVYFGSTPCGKVQVLKKGLYYRFICRCRLSSNTLCRLMVSSGDKQEDLGILVPMEDGFGLEKSIPVKRMGEGSPEFRLAVKKEVSEEKFVPICPEEPFAYLARIKQAYLVERNGQAGILL